ncbi:MAG: cysteine hydrolase family protein [Chloroflexi bacterium]|nr:cysteine hydrolase family protein [Chloroflexota bacterium]
MPFPDFYDARKVGTDYRANIYEAVEAGVDLRLAAAERDRPQVALVLVDMQRDFVHRDGALYVPGAVEDCRRIVEWIYRHVAAISKIFVSLDSHYPLQIFFSTWWRDADGQHPAPNTVITAEDVHAGRWQPVYEREWTSQYVDQLENQHKKQLMIWPFHTMVGTSGYSLSPALYEAICYHSAARQAQPELIIKGDIAKTEHYSILEPEVKVADHPQGQLNLQLLGELAQFDLVYIAGEAKSHCILETVNSMMRHFRGQGEVIGRLRVLEDAMSSVRVPGIDFEAMTNAAFAAHRRRGLTFVSTGEGIG